MSDVRIDSRDLIRALNGLTDSKLRSAKKKAIRTAMTVLLKETKSNLRKVKYSGKKLKTKNLIKGVKLQMYKRKLGANVNVLRYPSLHLFETGTTERRTSRGKFTGKITASNFFSRANTSKITEVYRVLEEKIDENIIRAFEG